MQTKPKIVSRANSKTLQSACFKNLRTYPLRVREEKLKEKLLSTLKSPNKVKFDVYDDNYKLLSP